MTGGGEVDSLDQCRGLCGVSGGGVTLHDRCNMIRWVRTMLWGRAAGAGAGGRIPGGSAGPIGGLGGGLADGPAAPGPGGPYDPGAPGGLTAPGLPVCAADILALLIAASSAMDLLFSLFSARSDFGTFGRSLFAPDCSPLSFSFGRTLATLVGPARGSTNRPTQSSVPGKEIGPTESVTRAIQSISCAGTSSLDFEFLDEEDLPLLFSFEVVVAGLEVEGGA